MLVIIKRRIMRRRWTVPGIIRDRTILRRIWRLEPDASSRSLRWTLRWTLRGRATLLMIEVSLTRVEALWERSCMWKVTEIKVC